MAGADYLLCGNCGAKTIYDADVDYDTPSLGQIVALCAGCVQAGYRLALYESITDTGRAVFTPAPTRDQLAQSLYEAAWPGSRLEESLPEVRANFARMADTAAATLHIALEDQ